MNFFNPEWSALKKLMYLKATSGGTLTEKTATGNPAVFSSTVAQALTGLSIPFSPVQDLHGYDHPWPGGGGKNIIVPYSYTTTSSGITFVYDSNTVTLSGTATADVSFPYSATAAANGYFTTLQAGEYTLSYTSVNNATLVLVDQTGNKKADDAHRTFTLLAETDVYVRASVTSGTVFENAVTISYQIEAGSTATSIEPYSNICPITGWTGLTISHSGEDTSNPTAYAVDWIDSAGTVYGGTLDAVSGVLTVDRANIASYNGETLPGAWISDRDVYAEGATPTTGAQVVYELATPTTVQLSPVTIQSIIGTNTLWTDTNGTNTIKYMSR